jgi:hypothetical protein
MEPSTILELIAVTQHWLPLSKFKEFPTAKPQKKHTKEYKGS